MKKIYSKISKCRISEDKKLIKVCDFGKIKLTGIFPRNKNQILVNTPLEIVFSKKSKLLQLNHNYNSTKLFGMNYGYRSGLNKSMVNHLKLKSKKLNKIIRFNKSDKILDIGSNDGTFLKLFPSKIFKFGCDPTAKKFRKYYDKSTKIIPKIFNEQTSKKINVKFKLISCIAMFYDLSDPVKFCNLVESKLDKNGIFHIEIAYLPFIYKTFSFDTFCQEHLTYYSLTSFENLIKKTNFKILDYETNSINGGSINFNLALNNSKHKVNLKKINKLKKFEDKNKFNNIKYVKNFFKNVKYNINKIETKIKSLKGKVYGFGASTKGNVTLQLCNITNKDFQGIYDINKEKFGKITPGSNIKIEDEKKIIKDQPDYLVFLIWHFKNTISEKLKKFKLKNTKYIWLFPKYKITKNK